MLNPLELNSLYQLLKNKSNKEAIQLALHLIKNNDSPIDLKLYDQLIHIIQDIELENSANLEELTTSDLLSKILHVNAARTIHINKKNQLDLLEYKDYFNDIETIKCWSLNLDQLPNTLKAYQKNLKYLSLENNQLSVLPDFLAEFNILHLNLFANKITVFPLILLQFIDLEELQLGANQISEIPEAISQLKHLKYLGLVNNHIKKLPTGLQKLTNLEVLALTGNPIQTKDIAALQIALPNTCIYFT